MNDNNRMDILHGCYSVSNDTIMAHVSTVCSLWASDWCVSLPLLHHATASSILQLIQVC